MTQSLLTGQLNWLYQHFLPLENRYATRVIIMSADELGTMSKYSWRGITLGISSVSLYLLFNFFINVHAIGLIGCIYTFFC